MTLGFPTDLSKIELSEGFRTIQAGMQAHPAQISSTAGRSCENVMTGDDDRRHQVPDAAMAPARRRPLIGTGCYNIMRDPDKGWINCGTYRVMIHDAKVARLLHFARQARPQMRDKYTARGERMPVAVVCGGDPMSFLMGWSEVPYGVCELEVIGGMRGAPVDVIKGPVTGLPIPANAEIVIEGFVEPDNVRTEGPFGEWTGYYASDLRPSR